MPLKISIKKLTIIALKENSFIRQVIIDKKKKKKRN